ncbi:UNVERIFIED_CONTAM: hypothetical protein GTU68_017246, partial [Idotea baltica]|nr:hypothetical protein [Idotea baltica]
EINEAFETLQKTLPDLPGVDAEKLTKITVLRLAVNYIKILSCVKDGDLIGNKDIDELRNIWCLKNAHMARPEHCVRPIFRTNKLTTTHNKTLKVMSTKSKPIKTKTLPNCKPCDASKEKSSTTIKKKSSKSRTRGKVCKTASVATSNGAYITLKNVAFQCQPNRKGHLGENKPLMMSMTVKRPRLEHVSFKKPPKIARYEPPIPQPKIEKTEPNNLNFSTSINYNSLTVPYTETISPHLGNIPFNFIQPDPLSPVDDKYLTSFTIYDLDSPVVKNDVVLEFPRNSRLSSSSSLDSALYSEGSSVPSSPKSPSPLSFVPPGEFSPNSTRSSSTVSPSYSSSDTDSVLAPSMEFDSLLGSEPFEEELDHLTSSLVDADDALNLFLDHHSSNFICSDINSY